MHFISPRTAWAVFVALLCASVGIHGCSRTKYRLQADREAYHTIAERNCDPRWSVSDYSIEMDPRSRYFDPNDPDRPPMPPDDPASHEYMHCVDGKKGWKYWHSNGSRSELENPAWRDALGDYVEISEDGSVKLSVDSALKLAYAHSPSHQSQLETLYLSALDVTAERFQLDTRFFGGYDARYDHNGSLVPAALGYSPLLRRFVVNPPVHGEGVENNRLTVGRPSAADPALQARRRFATAGDLVVGFANSFVFEFTGSDANLAASLANFSLVQPLLRGAGRDIALEELTFRERALLADLRAYSQYRQGFYTQVAVGESGVTGPQRGGGGTNVSVSFGQGGVSGYIGLLRQLQQIRNTENHLNLQLRTVARLEAYLEFGAIDLVQVDEFRQNIENERARLLLNHNAYALSVDFYKTGTLGLPPDLPVELDDSLIHQFQLVAEEATAVRDSITELQDRVGKIAELLDLVSKMTDLQENAKSVFAAQDRVGEPPDNGDTEEIHEVLRDAFRLVEAIQLQLEDVQADLAAIDAEPAREQAMTDAERELVQLVRDGLDEGVPALKGRLDEAKARVAELQDGLSEETKDATVRENAVWLRDLLRLVEGCILVQSSGRLEGDPIGQAVTDLFALVEPVERMLGDVQPDLARMEEKAPVRELAMTDVERQEFRRDREQLGETLAGLEQKFQVSVTELEGLQAALSEETRADTARGIVVWLVDLLQLVQRSILVQARARLEAVAVETIDLSPQDAFEIALANRLDFMNARAALVDDWRSIQVRADALKSVLNVTASGDLRTARNNPVSFRAPTGKLRLGLEFDAPLTRLLERNAYREELIRYQRSRRGFVQSRDSLHLGLRALLRDIEQLRKNLEIQRRAVVIAIRRVDLTQEELDAPVAPAQPGQRVAQFNPTTAINLLSAQSALRDSQNNLMSTWLNYYAAKMRLARELGIMELDRDGRWTGNPIPSSVQGGPWEGDRPDPEELPLPLPTVPPEWIELAELLPQESDAQPAADVESPDKDAEKQPMEPVP